jgi:hypothetical protein
VDQWHLVHGGFLFLPQLAILQNSYYLSYLQTLLYYPYYFWILELFVCGFSIICLPFVLLRQKGTVFVILDRDCIFNRSSDFCPRMVKGEFDNFIGYILLKTSLPCKCTAGTKTP